MSWRLVLPPEVEKEIMVAAEWYDSQRSDLGARFKSEILGVLLSIEANPFLNSRRDANRNLRWRIARPFSYRVVYEIHEQKGVVVVLTIQHTARDDQPWHRLIPPSGL